MVTILIHISDETAEALATCRPLHNQLEGILREQIALQAAQHPDTCADATCPDLVRIETARELLKKLECVSRFTHDVLGAVKFAKVSA